MFNIAFFAEIESPTDNKEAIPLNTAKGKGVFIPLVVKRQPDMAKKPDKELKIQGKWKDIRVRINEFFVNLEDSEKVFIYPEDVVKVKVFLRNYSVRKSKY